MKQLRSYQTDLSIKGARLLKELKLIYYACQVRTGKTLISLETAKLVGAKNVVFITKKKAIPSIEADYSDFEYSKHFSITVVNDESIHKITDINFDLVIRDESHRSGAFPKPGKATKLIKAKFSSIPMILLSGTPTPESFSQIFNQMWVSDFSPFSEFKNFYSWAKTFVTVKQKKVTYGLINDYSNANKSLIDSYIDKYMITFTQEKAGFTSEVKETILHCNLKESTLNLIKRLEKDLVVQGNSELILADTAVKLMSKMHQLFSGTIRFESGNRMVIDLSKAEFIKSHFTDKIAIFYKFKAEYDALKQVYGDMLTDDLEEFNATNKNIALQIISGREGISLRNAKFLVYYNIDFSATSYWQSRDRLTTMDRLSNEIFWIFSVGGIEKKIHQAVMNKKNFTSSIFKKEYGFKFPK